MRICHTVSFVKSVVGQVVQPGCVAVDGTVGNGHDTLYLARLAGPQGAVHGFDIQQTALDSARERLRREDAPDCVRLHLAGHETMRETLPRETVGRVRAVMFNFGYLPGSDGSVITRPETSCAAVDAALSVLAPGGLVTMVLYTGHPGGAEEADALETHCAALPTDTAWVMRCGLVNHPNAQTRVLLVEKR